MDKLIITVAVCGAEVTRKDTPYIPITPEEIAQQTYEAYLAGASIVHLHVRDENGNPTQDPEIFKRTVRLIRQKCPDIIVQVSTGGAVWMTPEERLQSLEADPDMATLTTGTVNFGNDVFYNSMPMIEKFASVMKEKGIMPEFECFDLGHINNAMVLVKKGLVQGHLHFDFVMGVPGGIAANARNLVTMVDSLPPGATWSVVGIGRHEFPMAAMAIVMGGHVRVGLEDNIYIEKGALAKSNAELVEKVVRLARELGRPIATAKEAREILQLGERKR
ncbi:3-keto-5-aminohexanoate cleavage protein [Thermotoga sp. Ku-13t]|uniref:3-keto-5-aminohexanoate cleavage enzyme n=1 Tax=Thermotoga sp. Ku-13t TaxID=1755813 RepID=UPI0013ECCE63|nr:3-keto-5-aminohexanoate cleavage protein [Thermotoga sp. Ku-13t]KAF2957319.1 3-keto-5-aminohexanoate cleavage protein [Thermotoga sp. Ku-13t]